MTELPTILSTSTAYKGRLFDIEVTEMRMANGALTKREGLVHPGAVAMIPVTAGGNLLLVTQYRHSAGKRLLEIPAGTLEKGEAPLAAVSRELQEEVGMRPGRIKPLGGFYVAPGYTSEYIHLFICEDLAESSLDGDEDEDIDIHELSAEQAIAAIQSGDICDAKSVIGILRWLHGPPA
jgi:ADP-ribose pyrophosphatase